MLEFRTPPRNQGQIVTRSFALAGRGDLVVMRVSDTSEPTDSDDRDKYYVAGLDHDDDGCYWDHEPYVVGDWRRISRSEAVRLGLRPEVAPWNDGPKWLASTDGDAYTDQPATQDALQRSGRFHGPFDSAGDAENWATAYAEGLGD